MIVDMVANYKELREAYIRGEDFVVETKQGQSGVIIMAPHGGGIEPTTDQIALVIAGREHSYYAFKSMLGIDNEEMHLTSNNFDEPTALRMVRGVDRAVTIHGCADVEVVTYVGGRDRVLGAAIIKHLRKAGFRAEAAPGRISGRDKRNICNRTRSGEGVQLELSRPQRNVLKNKRWLLAYAKAIRRAIALDLLD